MFSLHGHVKTTPANSHTGGACHQNMIQTRLNSAVVKVTELRYV